MAPGPLVPIPNTREFIFDTLVDSFPFVQPILDADKAAVAGRDEYDDQYFTLFFGKVKPIRGTAAVGRGHACGVDDRRGLGPGGPPGASPRGAANSPEGPA